MNTRFLSLSRWRGLWCVLLLASVAMPAARAASAAAPEAVGRSVLELPPREGNPRNSEGAFLDLKDGRIVFVYSHFVGAAASDHAKARLAARYTSDGGDSWGEPVFIPIPGEDTAMNVMSVSLLRMANGDLGIFYLLRLSWHEMRMHLMRSTDEGRTWSAPVNCMPAGGYYVVNNDRVVRLASGRIVIPAARHPARADRNEAAAVDWRGVATFFLSDDDGVTWRESRSSCTLPVVHTKSGLQEPLASAGLSFVYGLILALLALWGREPLSTTWVFLGLLAGRELALLLTPMARPVAELALDLGRDLALAALGLAVSLAVALAVQPLRGVG